MIKKIKSFLWSLRRTEDLNPRQEWLHKYLFERHTRSGVWFEKILMALIVTSIIVVMLESVNHLNERFKIIFTILEWFFTIVFTLEYVLRLYAAHRPLRYATSFYGIIDLVSILPTFISAIFVGAHAFLIIRILRLFRMFRLFKLIKFSKAGLSILSALKSSREKILVFLIFVLTLVTIIGSVMYIVEGVGHSNFTSIPKSIYWAVVTLTTVGYGDIAPVTEMGQFLAAAIMILGYAVLAVPTGIVSAEMVKANKTNGMTQDCNRCGKTEHEIDSRFCNRCGERIVG